MESRSLDAVIAYGPDNARHKVGITSFNFEGLDPADVGRTLDRRFGIMVRTGLHCAALAHRKLHTESRGAIRVSFGCFNTFEDVACVAEALQQITTAIHLEAR
jgi:selenocysteine lyase/cysteine desulfurase